MGIPFGSVGDNMAPKRLMQLEEYLACPKCGSTDWKKEGPEGEIKTFTCMNNRCGGAFQRAHQFRVDDCKPWMRPHTAINFNAALPGGACCVDAAAARTGKKRCHLHDSVNYTQTKGGSWYYAGGLKPKPPQLRPPRRIVEGEIPKLDPELTARLKKQGLLDEDGRCISAVAMDVTRRASESVKEFTESTKKIGEAAVRAGDAFVDLGEVARKYRDEREAQRLKEREEASVTRKAAEATPDTSGVDVSVSSSRSDKPGGHATEKGWSGEGKTESSNNCLKMLVLMVVAGVIAYTITFGLDWLRGIL